MGHCGIAARIAAKAPLYQTMFVAIWRYLEDTSPKEGAFRASDDLHPPNVANHRGGTEDEP